MAWQCGQMEANNYILSGLYEFQAAPKKHTLPSMRDADLHKNSPMRGIISAPIVLQSGIEVRNRDESTVCQGRDVRGAKTVGKAG